MRIDAELYPWISAGAIAWGVLDCFFGYRVFKVTLAVVGCLLGAVLGHAAGAALGFALAGELAGLVIGGLVGGGLAFMLYSGAVFVAGFGLGATLGVLLLKRFDSTFTLVLGIGFGVVGGFLAVWLQRILIIVSTALLGSFRAVLAAAYFVVRVDWLYYYEQPRQIPALIDSHGWMFPSIVALAVAGVIAQFELGGSPVKKKSRAESE